LRRGQDACATADEMPALLSLADRQRADRTFSEIFSLDSEGMVEAGSVVFPRNCGSEFD
jgi:hypothetical protein